jgi:hypothetical protein
LLPLLLSMVPTPDQPAGLFRHRGGNGDAPTGAV